MVKRQGLLIVQLSLCCCYTLLPEILIPLWDAGTSTSRKLDLGVCRPETMPATSAGRSLADKSWSFDASSGDAELFVDVGGLLPNRAEATCGISTEPLDLGTRPESAKAPGDHRCYCLRNFLLLKDTIPPIEVLLLLVGVSEEVREMLVPQNLDEECFRSIGCEPYPPSIPSVRLNFHHNHESKFR